MNTVKSLFHTRIARTFLVLVAVLSLGLLTGGCGNDHHHRHHTPTHHIG